MVKRIFRAFGADVANIHEAAYLLGAFALLAQILALFRDRLLAHYFGASSALDIYYAAFRIPDLIFATVASFVAGSVLIPFLQDKLLEGNENAKRWVDEIWSAFSILVVLSAVAAFFLMPFLVSKLFSTMNPDAQLSVVNLSRILLLSPIFLGFSNFLGSIIQAHRRFALYALSPVLYNVGIIAGIIFLLPTFGIKGVVLGVVLGSILHAVIQIPFARKVALFPKFTFRFSFERVKSVVLLSLPRTLALASMNLVFIALISLASRMAEGSISVFNFAYNLQSAALSVIGVSYSMAAFPTLARIFAAGEREKFSRYVASAFRHIIFWSLPAAALFIVIRAQIVRVVLGSGAFSWSDTRLVAACVALFAISIIAQNGNLLFIRAYYAAGKTKIPLVISAVSSVFTIVVSFVFYKIFLISPLAKDFIAAMFKVSDVSGVEILSLPLGFTVGSLFNMALFVFIFNKDFKQLVFSVRRTVAEGLLASFAAGAASYIALLVIGNIVTLDTLAGVLSQGIVAGVFGWAIWFFTLRALKSREAEELLTNIKGRIWKANVIAPEQTEI